jgi:hypothetical protein
MGTLLIVLLVLLGITLYAVGGTILHRQFDKRFVWFNEMTEDLWWVFFLTDVFWPVTILITLMIYIGIYVEKNISKVIDSIFNVSPLIMEHRYYVNNKKGLLKQFEGKVIVIKDKKVIGSYDNQLDAVNKTVSSGYKLGTFLVQKVEQEDECVTIYTPEEKFVVVNTKPSKDRRMT